MFAQEASNDDQSNPLKEGAQKTVLILRDKDKPVLRYHSAHVDSPDPKASWYGRSGFIHPVYTPSGKIVTDDFPSDHLHQHGLMFAWTSATIDGRRVDFWNSHKKEGRVEHVATLQSDFQQFQVKLRHVDLTADTPRPVIDEIWTVKIQPHKKFHVFDLESQQTNSTSNPILIRQHHYGAMCIRGAESWLQQGQFLTSDGNQREAGNHTRPVWVCMYGKVDGSDCGIAAMAHPTNLNSPQPVRLHPEKPYFCFAPMIAGKFQLKPNEPFQSRFRFVSFDGKPDVAALNLLWNDFKSR